MKKTKSFLKKSNSFESVAGRIPLPRCFHVTTVALPRYLIKWWGRTQTHATEEEGPLGNTWTLVLFIHPSSHFSASSIINYGTN